MKTAKDLMLAYIDGTAEQSGALFGERGTLELPYMASIGVPPVSKGAAEDRQIPRFSPRHALSRASSSRTSRSIWRRRIRCSPNISSINKSGITGKDVRQQFFGHLEAADGKIKRLREAIDVVVAAEAIYPNGLADVIAKKS